MTQWPRAAVVIVNLNGGELIERALTALDRQTVIPHRVIVVDNASTDGSVDGIEARHGRVEVVRLERNVGFAAGNNLAVRMADDCEWVALLNPDAFPEPGWLEAMLQAARDEPVYTFFGACLVRATAPGELDGTGDVYHASGLAWRRQHGRPVALAPAAAEEIFSPCAAAAMYRRDAFLGVGGFDERFFCYFEDSDLAFRLRLAGHRCLYVPGAVVHHVGSALTGRESDFTIYNSHRNMVWAYVKNMPGSLFWRYLPQHLVVNLLTVVWYSIRGQARTILAAKRDALLGLPGALRQRRAIQAARRVAPAEIRKVIDVGIGAYVTAFMRARTSLMGGSPEGR